MFQLGPPLTQRRDPSLLEAYFSGDISHIAADAVHRPDHYSAEQKLILQALSLKQPVPNGTTDSDLNDIVLRFTEKSEQRKKREEVVRVAQKKLDPTAERLEKEKKEQEAQAVAEQNYEDQKYPGAIKII